MAAPALVPLVATHSAGTSSARIEESQFLEPMHDLHAQNATIRGDVADEMVHVAMFARAINTR